MINPVILFIPVSSIQGIGEYARSLIIAQAIKRDIPDAQIHFILNKHAKYSRNCPFQVHYSDHSATKDTPKVIGTIKTVKPDLAIFDCSGRARQYAAARSVGAKVIFISQHQRKRARGIKLRRLFSIDLHWVVQPTFAMKPLSWLEKLKLKILKKPQPSNIGPILPHIDPSNMHSVLKGYQLKNGQYFVFSAGSGGHELEGQLVADIFYQAAILLQRRSGIRCVVVFGDNYSKKLPKDSDVLCLVSLPSADFIILIGEAKGRILGAGDTLLQAISLRKPSVGIAVSKDQPIRLEKCVSQGLAISAVADPDAICCAALSLLQDEVSVEIISNLNKQKIELGLTVVVRDIIRLLDLDQPTQEFPLSENSCSKQKKYLFFISQDYSFPILRPLQKEMHARGDLVKWFLYGEDISKNIMALDEIIVDTITDVVNYSPDAVFVPGNVVPAFISGIKVQVFHGLPSSKVRKNGQLYHYIIRGMFDLYCTQGPSSTEIFESLKNKHGYFQVVETGWCKLDPLFESTKTPQHGSNKAIFFASTFSHRFSRAKALYPMITKMIEKYDFFWYITLHPKMDLSVINLFKLIDSPKVKFLDSTNLDEAFKNSSLMLCDTSSIIYEFLTLKKPVVTFQTETNAAHLINVERIEDLERTILTTLNNLEVNKSEIQENIAEFHPYADGKSSERTLDAVENMLSGNNLPKKSKPKNILRNYRLRRDLNYWKI